MAVHVHICVNLICLELTLENWLTMGNFPELKKPVGKKVVHLKCTTFFVVKFGMMVLIILLGGIFKMQKAKRQLIIEKIITQHQVGTQEELMHYLQSSGIEVTQATLSRDMKDLKIIKQKNSNGKYYYTIFKSGNENEYKRLYENISEYVISIKQIQFLNIIQTMPNYANMIGAIIDDIDLPEVQASIAGHDTLVIFCNDNAEAQKFNQIISQHLK